MKNSQKPDHQKTTETSSKPRRLVIASNRLPVSLTPTAGGGLEAHRSSGGLASALAGVAEEADFDWVGWPGIEVVAADQEEIAARLAKDRLFPVFLDAQDEELYYHGVSNGALWPLFHYFTDKVDFQEEGWRRYEDVNRRFADAIVVVAPKNARVWVQDFHLMLVPKFLREARPDLEIGFFLHIPFPSSELYRLLPAREELLLGLLRADYIAFQTHDYARHFRSACLRVLGVDTDADSLNFEGRHVGIGVHPVGIDVAGFQGALSKPETRGELAELANHYGSRRLILGIERLDYTKGVAHKLRAFERVLERRPELAREVVFLQVIVPSREESPEYAALKREIEEFVGRINGRFGRPGFTPVQYLHRSIPPTQLAALYRFAHVCMVTPVRDGMNLVAQEYVYCQGDHSPFGDSYRGALVLSEFAGASQVLARALLVNPWDLESTADALEQALEMPAPEREERMRTMVEQVRAMDCSVWARRCLAAQSAAAAREIATAAVALRDETLEQLREAWRAAAHRLVLLDYDGTLREIVRTPEDAVPSAETLALLADLAADARNEVHVVSGRTREDLDGWLGDLDIGLCAEHGYAWRVRGQRAWAEVPNLNLDWMPAAERILRATTQEVPGTRLERKRCSLAWHYRTTDVDYGTRRARDLHVELQHALSRQPVEILQGHRVLEVRAAGVNKGVYAARVAATLPPSSLVLCVGDDRTDADMYRALPASAFTVHVGNSSEDARWHVPTPARLRAVLRSLISGD